MKLTKCNNNHFYDADKFSQCPHCGQSVKQPTVSQTQVPQSQWELSQKQEVQHSGKTIAKTSSMWQFDREPEEEQVNTVRGTDVAEKIPAHDLVEHFDATDCVPERKQGGAVAPIQPEPVESASREEKRREENRHEGSGMLQSAVDMARGSAHTEDTKTVAFYNFAESEPVVGWIVCVKGAYLGESFPLKAGRNLIGRSLKMDVALAKELSVSRDRHAIVIYEPKKRKFYLQPGEGSGLSYINDELLMLPAEMHDYDKLQFGEGEFIFRSLCGGNFTWDDYT